MLQCTLNTGKSSQQIAIIWWLHCDPLVPVVHIVQVGDTTPCRMSPSTPVTYKGYWQYLHSPQLTASIIICCFIEGCRLGWSKTVDTRLKKYCCIQSTNHNSLENRPSCYAMSSTVYDTFRPIPDLISCAGLTSHVFSAMICRHCSLTQCFTFLGYNEIALGQRKLWISNVHIHEPILKIKVLFTNMCRKVVLDPKKLVYFCLLYHKLK